MILAIYRGFLDGSAGKVSTRNAGDIGDDSLEEEMAAHSSVLAWNVPWTEGPWWAVVHSVIKHTIGSIGNFLSIKKICQGKFWRDTACFDFVHCVEEIV